MDVQHTDFFNTFLTTKDYLGLKLQEQPVTAIASRHEVAPHRPKRTACRKGWETGQADNLHLMKNYDKLRHVSRKQPVELQASMTLQPDGVAKAEAGGKAKHSLHRRLSHSLPPSKLLPAQIHRRTF